MKIVLVSGVSHLVKSRNMLTHQNGFRGEIGARDVLVLMLMLVRVLVAVEFVFPRN